ncbi:MAG: ABC transporter permease [Oliverpabstia sp.]
MKNSQKVEDKPNFYVECYMTPFIFLVLFLINCMVTKNFASWNTVKSIITQSTSLVLISIGMTLVISSGYIDISLGSGMAWNSVMFALILEETGSLLVSLLAVVLCATLVGVINGISVAKFRIQPMIATMSMMYILRAFAKVLTNGAVVRIRNRWLHDVCYVRFFGNTIPIQFFLILVPLLIGILVARKTRFGIHLEAIGNNPQAAKISGIPVVRYVVLAYIACNILAAIGGIWDSSSASSADPMALGILYEMDAIAAVVIGGTPITGGKANLIGTVFGVFILQIINMMINMNNISAQWSYVVTAVVIIVAVAIQNIKKMRGV